MEKPLHKKHAANTVVSNIERYGEKAIVDYWNLPYYGRIKELLQGVLSSFFFNRVLGIGEKGFTSVLSIENL